MSKVIIKVSPSRLNLIQSCSRAAYYYGILGYSSSSKPDYLVKGEIAHKILEERYKGTPEGDCISLLRNEIINSQVGVETGEEMVLTLRDYFSYYPDTHLEVLEVEKSFSVIMHEDEETLILLEGRIDLIANHKTFDRKVVIDHKTSMKFNSPSVLNNQYAAYCFATGVNDAMENMIIWGRPKKSSFDPSTKFHRTSLQYTPEFLEEWRQNSVFWVLNFHHQVQGGYFPPNYKSCNYCNFKSVCQYADEDTRQKMLESGFEKNEGFDLFAEQEKE